ncbi:MAG: hypothetical protein AAB388_00980, partial [Patescibacteria group bacterium]
TITQSGAGDILNIFDGATEVFTVLDGGSVGVGTSTPFAELVVDGDFALTGGLYDTNYTRGTNGQILQTTNSSVQWVSTSTLGLSAAFTTSAGLAALLSDETGSGKVVFDTAPTFNTSVDISGLLSVSRNSAFKAAEITQTGAGHIIDFTNSGGIKVVIDGAGRLGIGTTTPAYDLDVWGNVFVGTSSVPALFVNSANSRVGIGTSSPYAKFSVAGSMALTGGFYDNNASLGSNGYVLQSTGSGVMWVATSSLGISGGASLFTDGGATTYLTAVGDNLAVGTTTATSKFSVWGNLSVGTSSLPALFVNAANSHVGLGTTTPNTKLTVSVAEDTAALALADTSNGDQVNLYTGTTSPEGRVSAPVGSLFLDSQNGAMYQKTGDDGGNTSWGVFSVGTTTHMAQIVRASATTVPTSVSVQMDFDTATFDQGGLADVSTNRITVERSGKYLLQGSWTGDNVDSGEVVELIIYKNGSTQTGLTRAEAGGTNQRLSVVYSQVHELVAGDYLTMNVAQYEGANQDTLTTTGQRPTLTVTEVGRVQNING